MRVPPMALLAAALLSAAPAAAQDVTGRARAIQADQIAVGNQRISLYGVDAPDPDQDRECTAGRALYGCYTNAKRALEILIDLGPAVCVDTGEKNYINFAYMTCKVGGIDIGEDLVRQGWALAFRKQSDKYAAAEAEAKAGKKGLWQDTIRFTIPWEWREIYGRPVFGP